MDSTQQPPGLHDGGFAQVLNFRDVAATINAYTKRQLLREGLLFRAARPDEATKADRDRLRDVYKIRTVVDLRSKSEHARAAEKREADGKVPALLQSNEALAEPVQIPGIEYREIRVTGKGFERHMLKQLSWGSFGYVQSHQYYYAILKTDQRGCHFAQYIPPPPAENSLISSMPFTTDKIPANS